MALTNKVKGYVATTSWSNALTAGGSETVSAIVTICNTSASVTPTVSARITDNSAAVNYQALANIALPPGASVLLNDGRPVHLEANDSIGVISDTATIVELVISYQVET